MKYFTDCVDHPQDVAANPLPLGMLYEEVPTDLLDGFINYCTVLQGFALQTDAWDSESSYHEVSARNPENPKVWDRVFPKTYGEAYDLLIDPKNYSHPQLHRFRQDVLILAKAETDPTYSGPVIYLYFFYGISGRCDIGRFTANDSEGEGEVLAEFRSHAATLRLGDPRPIPLAYFNAGWVSF